MGVSATLKETVIWHDLECGAYRADLPVWRDLAAEAGSGARVLDIGAGTGRVAIELARAGHAVTALDREQALLGALAERAAGLPVAAVHADAREFALDGPPHDLCVVPMQTLQLLRGASERGALFACARAHLRDGASIACAILGEVDEFDSRAGGLGPSPERAEIDGVLYMSRAVRVAREHDVIAIERERLVLAPRDGAPSPTEHDRIELEILAAEPLWEELRAAGFEPCTSRTIPETEEHSGSEVVIARAV